jgi:hypothetical protein
VAVSPDPATAREIASWWVAFYLTSMGPLYRQTLRDLGHGSVVDDVLAANPSGRTTHVPASADALLDDLTIRGMPSPPGLAWTAGTPPAPNGPS